MSLTNTGYRKCGSRLSPHPPSCGHSPSPPTVSASWKSTASTSSPRPVASSSSPPSALTMRIRPTTGTSGSCLPPPTISGCGTAGRSTSQRWKRSWGLTLRPSTRSRSTGSVKCCGRSKKNPRRSSPATSLSSNAISSKKVWTSPGSSVRLTTSSSRRMALRSPSSLTAKRSLSPWNTFKPCSPSGGLF